MARRSPAVLFATIASFLIFVLFSACTRTESCTPIAQGTDQPNIILFLSDDEDRLGIQHMPTIQQYFVEQGTSFDNAFVTQSLCCPSRVSILRGQYPHNHGVISNSGPNGGFPGFFETGLENSTVATWLQDAGYYTGYIGKFLNGYGNEVWQHSYTPAGWDEWFANIRYSASDYGYYNNRFNDNGTLVRYGNRPRDYRTDVEARRAVHFIEQAACREEPFFLVVAPFAPHDPFTPAGRHRGMFSDLQIPRTPDFNEADISDKPKRGLPLFTPQEIERVDEIYRNRLRTLLAVDEMIASTIAALVDAGRLDNSYLVYMSDNGFHLGHHRLRKSNGSLFGKNEPYETDIRIPLLVRGPTIAPGETVYEIALNIDIAPTLTEWAQGTAPSFIDGRSLVPLLSDSPPGSDAWRQAFLVEKWQADGLGGIGPVYLTIWTPRYKYTVRNREGLPQQQELYDLLADPYELENFASSADPALIESLRSQLEQLSICAGNTCRNDTTLP